MSACRSVREAAERVSVARLRADMPERASAEAKHYQRIVDQWDAADARGQETVRQFRERIALLER